MPAVRFTWARYAEYDQRLCLALVLLVCSYFSNMSGQFGITQKPTDQTMTSTHPATMTMPDRMSKSMMTAPSPLKIFGAAKKRIRDIFMEVAAYIDESKDFVKGIISIN